MTPTIRDLRLRFVNEMNRSLTMGEESEYTKWLEQQITSFQELLEACYEDISWAMEDGLEGGQGTETLNRIETLIGKTKLIREIKNAPCPDDPPPQGEISKEQ